MFVCHDAATPEIYTDGHTIALPAALPCWARPHGSPLRREPQSRGHRCRAARCRAGGLLRAARPFALLLLGRRRGGGRAREGGRLPRALPGRLGRRRRGRREGRRRRRHCRSEEHTSELQSLMRSSYAVFCLKKKKTYYVDNQNIIL